MVGTEPAQGVDHGGDLAMEHASGLGFDDGAGGVAVVGMEQRRGLRQVTGGVDQVEVVAGMERSGIQVSAATG